MNPIVTVIGARPQFIKGAPVSRALAAAGVTETLVHTGQHYDDAMSQVFFDQLGIPAPAVNLGLGGGTHGAMTGRMLEALEQVFLEREPSAVIVYGDTNSTLAGALAAAKLHVPLVHVEAGLRSFNRRMPEEINRVLTDHIASLLICTSDVGAGHLAAEGVQDGVHVVGDVMLDAFRYASARAEEAETWPADLRQDPTDAGFYLMTLHRAENTDDGRRLAALVGAANEAPRRVVLPLHPRTRAALEIHGLAFGPNVRVTGPVGYLEMVALLGACEGVLTDSGGLQKEAYWAGKRCVTLRDETEWTETVDLGWNVLAGADRAAVLAALRGWDRPAPPHPDLYGDGRASGRTAALVRDFLTGR